MKQKTAENKSHSRAPGMTQISISLPQALVEKVDRLASIDSRSRSNFIAYVIDRLPENEMAGSGAMRVAEPKAHFGN